MNKSKTNRGPMFVYIVLMMAMLFALYKLFDASGSVDMVYSDVVSEFRSGNVEAFSVKNNTITMELRKPFKETGLKTVSFKLYDFSLFY